MGAQAEVPHRLGLRPREACRRPSRGPRLPLAGRLRIDHPRCPRCAASNPTSGATPPMQIRHCLLSPRQCVVWHALTPASSAQAGCTIDSNLLATRHANELTATAHRWAVTAPNVTFAALMHVSRQHGIIVQSIESQSARHVERVRYATRVRRDASLTATLACSGVTRVTRPRARYRVVNYTAVWGSSNTIVAVDLC